MSRRPETASHGAPITIVVVSYNSAGLLPDLLGSLEAGCRSVPFRLVVVDNGSSDDSLEVVGRLMPEAVTLSLGRNAGYAAGINAGVAAVPSDRAVLVLNPDVRLLPGCVERLVAELDRPGTGIAVPRLVDGDGRLISSMRREPTIGRMVCDAVLGGERAGRLGRVGEVVTDPRRYLRSTETDWAEGSTQLISASCWQACGPWDESFFLYSEETDFDLRARDAGFATRYVPNAGAIHLQGGSGSSDAQWALLVTNRVRLYRRRHGRLSTAGFWAATVVREGSRAALGRSSSRAAARALTSASWMRAEPGPQLLGATRTTPVRC